MADQSLRDLAHEAGIAPRWKDVFGAERDVGIDTLRAVLAALGLPAANAAEIEESRESLRTAHGTARLITAEAGGEVVLRGAAPGPYAVHVDGQAGRHTLHGDAARHENGAVLRAPDAPGYHTLEIAGATTVLAVAPRTCFTLADALAAAGREVDAARGARAWGLAAQLYGLRRAGDGGLGDLASLSELVRHAAAHGADAVSISPIHAQFTADLDRFSPYAPSSRVMGNVLHAPIDLAGPEASELEAAELIDWPRAARLRLAALARAYAACDDAERHAFAAWRAQAGESVELHARFEALHAHMFRSGAGPWHWRDWPADLQDCGSAAVDAFAAAHRDEIDFQVWLQRRVTLGLAHAQAQAKESGMAVGIISDLAVGTDSGGSHCWSRPSETLIGLTVGAPPDLLSREGQGWGITAFSPHGLRTHGFRAFIEMVRAALANAGGVRIDHAMGLNRLWVIPEGASAADGAYLSLPETDLMRLVRLESHLHRGIVLGEDLGTVPEGFTDRLEAFGIDGMRVLWFERLGDQRYKPPSSWTRGASAMTTTHDLPTVSGWWRGRDIDWNEKLGRDVEGARAERERDRTLLWSAMCESGAASGDAPGEWDGFRIADVAVSHVGRSNAELVMLPLEDALALEEAPNLPGTTDEHPNWRRRLPDHAERLLEQPHVAARLGLLARARAEAF